MKYVCITSFIILISTNIDETKLSTIFSMMMRRHTRKFNQGEMFEV